MGGNNSKPKDDLCILDNRPVSATLRLQRNGAVTNHIEDCPAFRSRSGRARTTAPCYPIRDIVYKAVGLKVNINRIYGRVSETLGCSGRISLWDCVSAVENYGDGVLDINSKRQYRRVMNHYHFVRPEDTETACALIENGTLVAAIWETSHGLVPVTLRGFDGDHFVAQAYDGDTTVQCDIGTDEARCMWALVKRREPVTSCLI